MVTFPWSIFFLSSLMDFTRTSFSLALVLNSSWSYGVLSSFFLKSSCWQRSTLCVLRVVHTSLILYLKPSSSFLLMGISLMTAFLKLLFSWAMRSCSRFISVQVFSRKVIRKGFIWKCWKRRAQSCWRSWRPTVMTEVMLTSSNYFRLQDFFALVLKRLLLRSRRICFVAIRMLVVPFIQTESTQNFRFVGFSWLYTPTPDTRQRYRKREQRQTSRRSQTSTNILGFTNPNLRVTQRLMGRVSLSPTVQKCVICSSNFSFSSTTGASQSILQTFFIHLSLKASIQLLRLIQLSLQLTFSLFKLPASNSRASPYPNPSRQSAQGMTTLVMRSFSFFQSWLTCRGLPMMMCLSLTSPSSPMNRFTTGSCEKAEARWCSCWERFLEWLSSTSSPDSSLMNLRRAQMIRPMSLPESGGAEMMRLSISFSMSKSCCWKSVGVAILSLVVPRRMEGQSWKYELIDFYSYIALLIAFIIIKWQIIILADYCPAGKLWAKSRDVDVTCFSFQMEGDQVCWQGIKMDADQRRGRFTLKSILILRVMSLTIKSVRFFWPAGQVLPLLGLDEPRL